MRIKADTPEEYIKRVRADKRETINRLRKIILENLPDGFTEEFSNQIKHRPDSGKGYIRFRKQGQSPNKAIGDSVSEVHCRQTDNQLGKDLYT